MMGGGGGRGKTYFSCSSKVDAEDVEMTHPVGVMGRRGMGWGRVVVVKDLLFLQQQQSRCPDFEMTHLVGVMGRRGIR